MLSSSKAFSSFSVKDLKAAEKFYSETLGLKVSEDKKMEILTLHFHGGSEAIIYPKPEHQPAVFTILNFPVKNIEEVVDNLLAHGVPCEQYGGEIKTNDKGIFQYDGMKIAWFKDPSGNILSILEEK